MSDKQILDELLTISKMITDDVDKEIILGRIYNLADSIEKEQDKATNYIDNLIKELN